MTPMKRARTGRAVPWLLATAGAVFAVDAVLRDTPARFRWFGVALGAALAMPLLLCVALPVRGPTALRRAGFVAIPTLALLLVAELLARALDLEAFDPPRLVYDAHLGHVLAPDEGDADAWGFRNLAVPPRADVVFVGDSQTYGFALRRSSTLPEVFARITGHSTYGMAIGGYGPVQYRELAHRALDLHPGAIVIVLYFGNDIVDAHRFAGLEGDEDLRDPQVVYQTRPTDADREPQPEPNLAADAVAAVARLSRLANWVAFTGKSLLKNASALADVYGQEPGAPRYDGGPIATLLTPQYRAAALDASTIQVRDGMRITQRCLGDIGALCRTAEVCPLLVLLPTKEAAYRELLAERGQDTRALDGLAGVEAAARDAVVEAARRAGLRIVDAKEALVAELRAGRAPWPRIADGHLTAHGVEVLARVVRDAMP